MGAVPFGLVAVSAAALFWASGMEFLLLYPLLKSLKEIGCMTAYREDCVPDREFMGETEWMVLL